MLLITIVMEKEISRYDLKTYHYNLVVGLSYILVDEILLL